MRKNIFKAYYLSLGLLGSLTLGYDAVRNIWQGINYWSEFTIISVLFASALFLLIGLAKKPKLLGIPVDVLRGASLMYLLTAGLMHFLFLTKIPDPNRIIWVDFVMHKLLPTGALIGWIIFAPGKKIGMGSVFGWLLFPISYLVYTLIRGIYVGWYPYYFLDATKESYLQILMFAMEIVVCGIIGSVFFIWVGNFLMKYEK